MAERSLQQTMAQVVKVNTVVHGCNSTKFDETYSLLLQVVELFLS